MVLQPAPVPSVPTATLPIILKTQDICTSLGSLPHLQSAWAALSVRGILPPHYHSHPFSVFVSFIGLAVDHSSPRLGRRTTFLAQDLCMSYIQVISQCWGADGSHVLYLSMSDHKCPPTQRRIDLVHSEALWPKAVLQSLWFN